MSSSQQQTHRAICRMLFYYVIISDSIFRVHVYTILTTAKFRLVSMISDVISGQNESVTPADHI